MRLFGGEWTRRELEAHTGRVDQVAGARRVLLAEGPGAGSEAVHVRTGAGLSLWIHPSRGMDIGLAEFLGTPLCWLSPAGDVHPAHFDPSGLGWLRTAAGGLLMTCGLRQVGSPCEDEGEQPGLHGRIHHTPAREVSVQTEWDEDEYVIRVRGVMEECRLFGENLRLTRTYRCHAGTNRLDIEDLVENIGFHPSPLMILYHFNLGFPLVSPEAQITFPSKQVVARDREVPVEGYGEWQRPDARYTERVYYHEELETAVSRTWARPSARISVNNPAFPFGGSGHNAPVRLGLSWTADTLPRLVQWKMPGAGAHVLGVEPANCHVEGRAEERRQGRLQILEPGESRSMRLAITVEALNSF